MGLDLEPQAHGGALARPRKGQTGNRNGRPPKLLSGMIIELKARGYERATAGTVIEALETLMNCSPAEIAAIAKSKTHPMSAVIVAKAMQSAKGWEVLEGIMDRAHGKAKQQIDMTGTGAVVVPTITVVVQPPINVGQG